MIIKGKEYTIQEIEEICKNSESYREVSLKLGYSPNGGGSIRRLKDIISDYNINISHFKGQGHTKNIGKYRTPTEDYLNNKVKITSYHLRERLLEEGIFEYRCCCCGNEQWLGKPIPLELHHIDGNKNNNNLNNLELRCPNCHYFTDTYKSKNRST